MDKDLFSLSGKVAVITGGAGHIGRRVAKGLAVFGAKVAVADVQGDAADEVAAELRSSHGTASIGIACDVASPASVRDMVDRVVAEFGRIDVLHNNAATKSKDLSAFLAPVEEFDFDVWRDVMSVNLDGMFLVAQAVGRRMIAAGRGGSIIQTASIYGVVAPDPRIYEGSYYLGQTINTPAVYATSKAGVIGLTNYLAAYWGPHSIRVNTLVPGGVESGQNDVFRRKYGDRTPLGRMARADEMVGAVVYLASDASSYVTGHTLKVDGGWTAW